MSYAAREQSVHDGQPIECYRFVGSFNNYLYTSAESLVTVAGFTFLPAAIKRAEARAGTQEDSGLALELELPYDLPLVQAYAFVNKPFDLSCEVYRVHRGTDYSTDYVLMWKGAVGSFVLEGRTCRLSVPSIFGRALENQVPSVQWQNPCNHVLYDAHCGVSRGANLHSGTVTGASGTVISMDDDGFADGKLRAGEIVNTRNGERRMILDNASDEVYISFPFSDIVVGDTVEVVRGCAHTFSFCKTEFSNGQHYGGFPYIPYDNPFSGELS